MSSCRSSGSCNQHVYNANKKGDAGPKYIVGLVCSNNVLLLDVRGDYVTLADPDDFAREIKSNKSSVGIIYC